MGRAKNHKKAWTASTAKKTLKARKNIPKPRLRYPKTSNSIKKMRDLIKRSNRPVVKLCDCDSMFKSIINVPFSQEKFQDCHECQSGVASETASEAAAEAAAQAALNEALNEAAVFGGSITPYWKARSGRKRKPKVPRQRAPKRPVMGPKIRCRSKLQSKIKVDMNKAAARNYESWYSAPSKIGMRKNDLQIDKKLYSALVRDLKKGS